MNRQLTFFIICMLLSALARSVEIPPASDYDFAPEEVFSPQLAFKGIIPPAPFTSYPESMTFSIDQSEQGKLLAQHVDWQSIIEMNRQASSVWTLMLSCSGHDEALARKNYLAHTLCPDAQAKLQQLRGQLNNFLSSTMADPLNLLDSLKCYKGNSEVSCPYNIYYDFSTNQFIGYNPLKKTSGEMLADGYLRMLNSIPSPRFHFLLIQLLLEQVAAGYPLNYGGHLCGTLDLMCLSKTLLIGTDRMVVRSNVSDWYLPRYFKSEEQRRAIVKWIDQVLTPNSPVPQLDPSLLFDTRLQLLRRGRMAARILNHMDLGPLHCDDWGLWPLASVDLVGILAQSRYDVGTAASSNELPILAIRLSDACRRSIPYTLLETGSLGGGLVVRDSWPSERNPITAVRMVGAWRGLLSRYEK